MAQDERQRPVLTAQLHRPIGVADPRIRDPHQHLVRGRLGRLHLGLGQRFAEPAQNCRAHAVSLRYLRRRSGWVLSTAPFLPGSVTGNIYI